jgi:hypothetical protein
LIMLYQIGGRSRRGDADQAGMVGGAQEAPEAGVAR